MYFYELLDATTGETAPPEFGHEVVRGLGRLDRRAGEHYQEVDENTALTATGEIADGLATIRLGYVLRSDWPEVERLGDISPLELDEGAGLLRAATFVFFDQGIVGAEYHWRAPTASRLPVYIADRLSYLPRMKMRLLLRQDLMDHLRSMRTIEKIEFQISSRRLSTLETDVGTDEPVLRAARALLDATQVENISVMLGHQPHRPASLPERVRGSVRNLVENGDVRAFRAFKIFGYDADSGHRIQLNVLKDNLVYHTSVQRLRPESNAIDPSEMAREIRRGHGLLLSEISTAASAQVT